MANVWGCRARYWGAVVLSLFLFATFIDKAHTLEDRMFFLLLSNWAAIGIQKALGEPLNAAKDARFKEKILRAATRQGTARD